MSAKLKICIWSPSRFRDNSRLLKQTKSLWNDFLKLRLKNLQCLLYRNVADDVLFQKHFTDLDYLDWFRHTNYFLNLGICKHEFKFTCRGYCRFILRKFDNFSSLVVENSYFLQLHSLSLLSNKGDPV